LTRGGRGFSLGGMKFSWVMALVALTWTFGGCATSSKTDSEWRTLPLVKNGRIDPSWVHVGYGGFVVEDATIRTAPAPEGLGLLVFKKERLGNCQIRVVFKAEQDKSNSGVYVRLADGILDQVGNPGPAFDRDAAGKPSRESMQKVSAAAEQQEVGPWYAVHHGYEVQIADAGDPTHGTGAIYSLAKSAGAPRRAGQWRTMIITLAGEKISVEVDGQQTTAFDPSGPVPPRKEWHEPKREPKRPQAGYIGLQNHDPGDLVWFKEISVRPLAK
jgi:hypothetical protein